MSTWSSKPDESWGGGGAADAPTVNEDYANVDGIDTEPIEEEKKLQRIRKKDIEQLQMDRQDGKEKFISIWQRAGKNEPLLSFMPKFSRGAAAVFSEIWRKQLDGNAGALIIEDEDMEPYKRILQWINMCVDEGNDIKFPEIINADNALHLLLDVITVADLLQIPEMSLQAQLKKAAIRYARHSLIDIEYIERIYDEEHPEAMGVSEPLREAAAASIFEAWWKCVLDDPEYDDYCCYLEQMRAKFPKLDEDLNKRFDDKKEYIQKKREERRQGHAGGGVGGGPSAYRASSAADYPEASGPDGGWGDAAATIGEAHAGEWSATTAGAAVRSVPVDEWGRDEGEPAKANNWAGVASAGGW